ncbi:hypothetical protein GLOIN_2v1490033 [Rhizophagus irregularis DAOM 181602=DAOM 197198]|uniref:Uncharacterized protein n=1 Tax=Rhizophagus irregularis (strain DAOM 181602 / DAOM 197198 / MUCL 43194) TaxID=747089 RepID=A0A2P4QZW2_RHIID|nr:hypothetical protein GLOIN_2v1490033 [Rhizophagus irregularis DAOM 181602=DAOM 197198]POG83179.1 hypothetical protein GLOIN_2v1490033 [Rhizophagus irregularis DAOM 181602=DAOM 197198]GET55115.1 hypothetical protein GLOIN_2v1490033 [Rhizophagus irregularis DAOM 181602=DAOM 197198]|eukprot:XP_025190045.1 hypothetical protein GLOIN_2v1490033 [Rhizophagus irregularis DAOM 181602=DAOM 197198]
MFHCFFSFFVIVYGGLRTIYVIIINNTSKNSTRMCYDCYVVTTKLRLNSAANTNLVIVETKYYYCKYARINKQ